MFQSIAISVLNYSATMNCKKVNVKEGEIKFYQTFSESKNPFTGLDLGKIRINVESFIQVKNNSSDSKLEYLLDKKNYISLNIGDHPVSFYIRKTDEIREYLGEDVLNVLQNDIDRGIEFIRFKASYAKLTILLSNGYFKLVNLKFSDDTKIEFEGTENNYTPFKDESLIKGRRIYIVDPNQVVKNNLFEEKQSRTIVDQDRLSEEYFASFKDNQIRQFQ